MKIDELSLEQYYLKEYMSAGACRYGALKRWQKEVLAKSFGYQAWRLKTAIDDLIEQIGLKTVKEYFSNDLVQLGIVMLIFFVTLNLSEFNNGGIL